MRRNFQSSADIQQFDICLENAQKFNQILNQQMDGTTGEYFGFLESHTGDESSPKVYSYNQTEINNFKAYLKNKFF